MCSQTSAGIWHRARAQQRPGVHESGAVAREHAGPSFTFFFCRPPAGEESAPDDADHAAPPGVVHINVAAAWRSEEDAFMQDSHFFQFLVHSSLSSFPLCKGSSRHSLSYSFMQFHQSFSLFLGSLLSDVSVPARLCLGAP